MLTMKQRPLSRVKKALGERTVELADTKRQLKQILLRRKVMQKAAEMSGQHYKQRLQESLDLQKRLRQLTQRVLATQENERRSISLELHNEIAQTLLGINVRLLTLKKEARVRNQGLKSEIATTQRLVTKSAQSVHRVARKIGKL